MDDETLALLLVGSVMAIAVLKFIVDVVKG